jgi:GxxExxY protein
MKEDDGHVDEVDEPDPELNRWTNAIIGACIEVHREHGPGFTEDVYESSLAIEFELRGIPFERQVPVPVTYKGRRVGSGRIDFVVADRVVVELKAVEALAPIHTAQVISYLKATRLRLAILVNFNVRALREGIKRIAR